MHAVLSSHFCATRYVYGGSISTSSSVHMVWPHVPMSLLMVQYPPFLDSEQYMHVPLTSSPSENHSSLP